MTDCKILIFSNTFFFVIDMLNLHMKYWNVRWQNRLNNNLPTMMFWDRMPAKTRVQALSSSTAAPEGWSRRQLWQWISDRMSSGFSWGDKVLPMFLLLHNLTQSYQKEKMVLPMLWWTKHFAAWDNLSAAELEIFELERSAVNLKLQRPALQARFLV